MIFPAPITLFFGTHAHSAPEHFSRNFTENGDVSRKLSMYFGVSNGLFSSACQKRC